MGASSPFLKIFAFLLHSALNPRATKKSAFQGRPYAQPLIFFYRVNMNSIRSIAALTLAFFITLSCIKNTDFENSSLSPPVKPHNCGKNNSAKNDVNEMGKKNYKAGEVLIKFKEHVSKERRGEIIKELDLEIIRVFISTNVYLLNITHLRCGL